jgi:pyruvate dehydrogenase E2 component (dihydrolipoamide acetyltransferase)
MSDVIDIVMPRLSDSMTEGVIVGWLKRDGERVERGDELVDVETDKATTTYEADAGGFLNILAREGATLPVGAVIAQLLSRPGVQSTVRPTLDPDAGPSSPAGASVLVPPDLPPGSVSASLPRVNASPLARRLARELGVDVGAVAGSGRGGRIVRADIEAAAPPAGEKGAVEIVELTRTQALIARRMSEAKTTVPEFTVALEVDAEAVLTVRDQLRGEADSPPSVNDFVVKAAALALREHPRANASYRDGVFELYSRINVGMAVAAPDSLVVPTIFDADQKSLREIAAEARVLAERVREGTIAPSELAAGTFTVSNLGMFGVHRFTAVINPPQAAILAVGAAVSRALPDDTGGVRFRRVMELTLSADHRILYGAEAAAFLTTIRDLLERPAMLLS